MKILIIILLTLYVNLSMAKDENSLGKTYLGIDYGFYQNLTYGYDYEELTQSQSYSIKLGKQIKINPYFNLDLYGGYSVDKYRLNYTNEVNGDKTFLNKTPFVQINPLYMVGEKHGLGLYIKGYTNKFKITETEYAINSFGANYIMSGTYSDRIRIGFYYEETNGTTIKKMQSAGISFQIGW